eukprot:1701961-Ditylum_brightwellii.AAC.1
MFIGMELQWGSSDTAGPDDEDLDTQQPRDVFKSDSWFLSVSTVEAICKEGGAYIGIAKTTHSLYPKKEIEDVVKTFPGGTHLVMESFNDDGSKMYATGYKHSLNK